jgi:AcrR family transcriptional regulator
LASQDYPLSPVAPSPARSERLYRGVSHAQRAAQRRGRFLDAAIRRFGGDGFHATTLKSLCTEAGLTERYFYESFGSFDELLCASYRHAADIVMGQAEAALDKADPTPAARMRCVLDAYFKAIAADPARARLILLEIEGASANADAVYRAQLRVSADFIRFRVCAGLPDNPRNGLSPGLLATATMGAIYQLAKEWVLSNFKPPREQLVRNALAIFVGTIAEWQKPAPPARRLPASRSKRA